MARRKRKPGKLYSDSTDFGAMVACPLCAWRALEDDPSGAWRAAYQHLRRDHQALESSKLAELARKNMRRHLEKRGK